MVAAVILSSEATLAQFPIARVRIGYRQFDAADWPENAAADQARRLIAAHGLERYVAWCNEADAAIAELS